MQPRTFARHGRSGLGGAMATPAVQRSADAAIIVPSPEPEEIAMAPTIGSPPPTREHVMAGPPEAAPLIALAQRAADLGFDSVWAGASLLARPRHDPLTLLAGVAARVP